MGGIFGDPDLDDIRLDCFVDEVERLRVGGTGGRCFWTLLMLSSVKLLDVGVAIIDMADALLDSEISRTGPGRLGGGGGGCFGPNGITALLFSTGDGWYAPTGLASEPPYTLSELSSNDFGLW